jgi:hypothetical protein
MRVGCIRTVILIKYFIHPFVVRGKQLFSCNSLNPLLLTQQLIIDLHFLPIPSCYLFIGQLQNNPLLLFQLLPLVDFLLDALFALPVEIHVLQVVYRFQGSHFLMGVSRCQEGRRFLKVGNVTGCFRVQSKRVRSSDEG